MKEKVNALKREQSMKNNIQRLQQKYKVLENKFKNLKQMDPKDKPANKVNDIADYSPNGRKKATSTPKLINKPGGEKENDIHVCTSCNKTFLRRNALKRHMKYCEPNSSNQPLLKKRRCA